jgi:Zn-dependent protease with chaperone function
MPSAPPVAPTVASPKSQAILDSFKGEPPPPLPVALHYRLGLFLIALAMILLPLIYISLIVLVAMGLYWHATHSLVVFESVRGGRGGLAALLIYVGPLVAGLILIFFMIKPLFAQRPKRADPRRLKRERESLLFAFVARVCEQVGAPTPAEIHVNSEVNASASFRRGLWSIFGGDLVLTIGLPLPAGLSVQQFAGVLAHEFGHFAQRAGMRTTYLINSINGWFHQVVYERDAWDVTLQEWSAEVDIRIGIIFYAARFCVWVTRQILWVLMLLGHAISCFMSRAMEYDADRHQAWLEIGRAHV